MRHATHVYVCLYGPMVVEVDDEHLELPWGKPRELVAYVAAYGPVHVEIAAEALWPNLSPGAGRLRLRNVVKRCQVVVRYGPLLMLPAGAEVDWGDKRYPERILPEYPFEDWAERLR